jgi:hypothetical protein
MIMMENMDILYLLETIDVLKISQATRDRFFNNSHDSHKFNDSRSNSRPLYKSNINIDHLCVYISIDDIHLSISMLFVHTEIEHRRSIMMGR